MVIHDDCILDNVKGWSVFVIVDDHGEPVRAEASREYVEEVFGVEWMDRAGRKKALEEAVANLGEAIQHSAGCGPDGHRVYRLG
jgi:hypothetical protein